MIAFLSKNRKNVVFLSWMAEYLRRIFLEVLRLDFVPWFDIVTDNVHRWMIQVLLDTWTRLARFCNAKSKFINEKVTHYITTFTYEKWYNLMWSRNLRDFASFLDVHKSLYPQNRTILISLAKYWLKHGQKCHTMIFWIQRNIRRIKLMDLEKNTYFLL